jgi:hypothetical protein
MVNSFLLDLRAAIKIIEIMYGFSSASERTVPLKESLLTCKRGEFARLCGLSQNPIVNS